MHRLKQEVKNVGFFERQQPVENSYPNRLNLVYGYTLLQKTLLLTLFVRVTGQKRLIVYKLLFLLKILGLYQLL